MSAQMNTSGLAVKVMIHSSRPLVTLIAIALAACTTPNLNRRPDAGPGTCQAGCTGSTSVCDTASNQCVQCTTADSSACSGATPFCGADNTCKGCTEHSQCASSVCRPDGTCSEGDDIAYVDPNGDGFACTKAAPCSALNTALDTGRSYVKMTGTVKENATISRSSPVVILADPDAELTADSGTVLQILGSSEVAIYDLKITGTKQTMGISMPMGATATLTLNSVTISNHGDGVTRNSENFFFGGALVNGANVVDARNVTLSGNGLGMEAYAGGNVTVRDSTMNNNGIGLYADSGSVLNVFNSTFTGNTRYGLAMFDRAVASVTGSTFNGNGYGVGSLHLCDLTVRQSTFISNSDGGLRLGVRDGYSASTLHILNNFIVRNGSSTSEFGGMKASALSGSEIKFNTIVDNVASASLAASGGVDCRDGVELALANNVITGNTGGPSNEPYTANCTNSNSYVSKVTDSSLGFVSAKSPPYDYHLTASTPATILDAAVIRRRTQRREPPKFTRGTSNENWRLGCNRPCSILEKRV